MKQLILTYAFSILFIMFLIYQQDNNRLLREMENLKQVADEVAATGGLCFDAQEYSEGNLVFNRAEADDAIAYMIISLMNTDDAFLPASNSYWTSTIKYDVYYFDKTNVTFPYLFTDSKTSYTILVTQPTVIVTINAGKPRHRLSFLTLDNTIRSGSYEYKGR